MALQNIRIKDFEKVSGIAAQMRYVYRAVRYSLDMENLAPADGVILMNMLKSISNVYRDHEFEKSLKEMKQQLNDIEARTRGPVPK